MKRIYIIYIAVITICIFSLAKQSLAQKTELKQGETKYYKLVLDFNDRAVDLEETVTFRIETDFSLINISIVPEPESITFPVDSSFLEITFLAGNGKIDHLNQVEFYEITIKARIELEDVNIPFTFIKVSDSEGIGGNVKIKEDVKSVLNEEGELITTIVVPVIPLEPVVFWSIIIGSCLIILLILFFVLKLPNMPLGPKTFKSGRLSFLSDNPPVMSINLSKLTSLSLDKYYPDTNIILKPIDKKIKNKTKRFARLYSGDVNLAISIENGSYNEAIGSSVELYHLDKIIIRKENSETIILEYSNNQIHRSYV